MKCASCCKFIGYELHKDILLIPLALLLVLFFGSAILNYFSFRENRKRYKQEALFRISGSINQTRKIVIPSLSWEYSVFLQFCCVVYFIGTLLFIIPSTSKYSDAAKIIVISFQNGLFDNWPLFVMMSKKFSRRQCWYAFGLAFLVMVIFLAAHAVYYFVFLGDKNISYQLFPIYTVGAVLYGVLILVWKSHILSTCGVSLHFRPAMMDWLWFLFTVYSVFSFSNLVSSYCKIDVGFCTSAVIAFGYVFVWNGMLFWTLKKDTHWSFNPSSVVLNDRAPLLENSKAMIVEYGDLNMLEKVGKGAFGEVWKADLFGETVAVKKLTRLDSKSLEEFSKEAKILASLPPHPNVLKLIGCTLSPPSILTDFAPKGNLYQFIHRKEGYTEHAKWRISLGIARGLAHLHKMNIIHRDLKSQNLLLDSQLNPKLADFGFARTKVLTTMTNLGTPRWVAPEVIREERYSEKADIYSLGVIFWELETRQVPYGKMEVMKIIQMVAYEELSLEIPSQGNPEFLQLMKTCMNNNPEERPSCEQATKVLEPLVEQTKLEE